MPYYFRSRTHREVDKEESGILTMKINKDFNDIFTGIGCFKDTFKMQVTEGKHLYQVPQKGVDYAL